MKYSILALIALLATLMTASADNSQRQIGNWSFSSGKITLDLKDGPPPEYGGLISLMSTDDHATLYVSCSNKAYHISVLYGDDAAPPSITNPRIHIDVERQLLDRRSHEDKRLHSWRRP
jgi:hypothetical protein